MVFVQFINIKWSLYVRIVIQHLILSAIGSDRDIEYWKLLKLTIESKRLRDFRKLQNDLSWENQFKMPFLALIELNRKRLIENFPENWIWKVFCLFIFT